MTRERRQFEFSSSVKQQARERQGDRCASCGDSLIDTPSVAHHAGVTVQEARQAGLENHPEYIKSVDNCAIVCSDCHEQFQHDGGKYRTAVEDSSALPYLYGNQAIQAQQLAMQHDCALENAHASQSANQDFQQQSRSAHINQYTQSESESQKSPPLEQSH